MKKKIWVSLLAVLLVMSLGLTACGNTASSTNPEVSTADSVRTEQKNTNRIGIIGAMDEEVSALKAHMTDSKVTSHASMEFCEGKLDGKDVVVVKCNIGKVNAGICAQTLVNLFGVSRIINTGVAGSLNADIDIGDIVVSTDAVQHDYDLTPLGAKPGEFMDFGVVAFTADDAMRKCAVEAVAKVAPEVKAFEGRVCSGDQFIASKEQKNKIINTFGGFCCEMEGGAIAQTCYLNNTPFVIIRAISDKADDSEEMSYEEFKVGAAARCAAVTEYVVTHLDD